MALGIGQKLLGGGTIYVGRVIIFSNKILGGSLLFLPKLRQGHNFFFIAKPADLNICPSNYSPTNWSFCVNSNEALFRVYLIQYISFLK